MSPDGEITFEESPIEEIAGLPFIGNNRVRLLESGQETFLKILDSLFVARHIICIDFYLFRDDDTGNRLSQVLKEKARKGVNVYVAYDHFGSLSTSRSFWSDMRRSGVKLKTSHPFDFSAPFGYFYRNHKKLIIVDGREAFIGGFNIADEYHGSLKKVLNTWRDTGIHLQGPVASTLCDMFIKRWRFHKSKPTYWKPSFIELDDGVSVIPIFAHSGKSRRRMRKLFLHSINNAKKSILLTTAYFIPGRRILRALERAGRRGVELKLLLPGITDVRFALHAGRAYFKRLLQSGVQIYTYQGTILHAKTAVFDDCWSIIGSANLDHQSFRRNEESNVGVLDPAFGGVMRKAFHEDMKKSIRIHPDKWDSRPLYQKVLERFFSFLLRKL